MTAQTIMQRAYESTCSGLQYTTTNVQTAYDSVRNSTDHAFNWLNADNPQVKCSLDLAKGFGATAGCIASLFATFFLVGSSLDTLNIVRDPVMFQSFENSMNTFHQDYTSSINRNRHPDNFVNPTPLSSAEVTNFLLVGSIASLAAGALALKLAFMSGRVACNKFKAVHNYFK